MLKHDDTDEYFMVLEEHLDIEQEDEMFSLEPRQAFTVPKGVRHSRHSKGRTVVLVTSAQL